MTPQTAEFEVVVRYVDGPRTGEVETQPKPENERDLFEVGSRWTTEDGTAQYEVVAHNS